MSQFTGQYAFVGTGKSQLGHLSSVSAPGLLEYTIKNALDEAAVRMTLTRTIR
jgi:hypothetical protein